MVHRGGAPRVPAIKGEMISPASWSPDFVTPWGGSNRQVRASGSGWVSSKWRVWSALCFSERFEAARSKRLEELDTNVRQIPLDIA